LLNSLPLISDRKDAVICNQLILNLNATAPNYNSILWENNLFGNFENNRLLAIKFYPYANTNGPTRLTISAKNNYGKVTDDLIVNYTPIPNADFILSDTLICKDGKPILIKPTDSTRIFFGENVLNKIFTHKDGG
jgi:hypothetical protein